MKAIKIFQVEDLDEKNTQKLVNNVLAMMDNDYEKQLILKDVATNPNSLFILTNGDTDQLYFDDKVKKFAVSAVDIYTAVIKQALPQKDKYETAYDFLYSDRFQRNLEFIDDVDDRFAATFDDVNLIVLGLDYLKHSDVNKLWVWLIMHNEDERAKELKKCCDEYSDAFVDEPETDKEEELLKKADHNYMMTKTEIIKSFYVNAVTGSVVTELAKADKDWIKVDLPLYFPARYYIPLKFLDVAVSQLPSIDDKRKLVKSAIRLVNEGYDTYLLNWYPDEFWVVCHDTGITDREYKTKEIKKIVADWENSKRKDALSLRLSNFGDIITHHGTNFTDIYIRNHNETSWHYVNVFAKGTQIHELYEIYLITLAHQQDKEETNLMFHYHLDQYLLERVSEGVLTLEDVARFITRHYHYDDYEIGCISNDLGIGTKSLKKQFMQAVNKEKALADLR